MPHRSALLISCLKEESATIHQRAELERRTVSGYVLTIVLRAVRLDEDLFASHPSLNKLNLTLARRPIQPGGRRTTMLLRCSTDESARIRRAAKQRDTTISGYILWALRRSWSISSGYPQPLSPTR